MSRRHPSTAAGARSSLLLAAALLVAPCAWSQADPPTPDTDLRGIRVGMPASELPRTGFAGFSCVMQPTVVLTGFDRWRDCPADPKGRHAFHFGYDPANARDGTRVAGHPVVLTLRVAGDGRVDELVIETDPGARPFLRKKAFLLGMQARSRYGDEGWRCEEGKPQAGEEPVGGVFLRERCVKQVADRSVQVQRELYRRSDQDLGHFVGRSRVDIQWVPG